MKKFFLISSIDGEENQQRLDRIKKGPLGVYDFPDVVTVLKEVKDGETWRSKLESIHKLRGHIVYPELLEQALDIISWYSSDINEFFEVDLDLDDWFGGKYSSQLIDVMVDTVLENFENGVRCPWDGWFRSKKFDFLRTS